MTPQNTPRHPDCISYENHPAYTGLIASATALQKIKSITTFCKYACIVFIKRVISYEQIPAHLRKPKTMSDFKRLLTLTFRHLTRSVMTNDITIDGPSEYVFNALQTQGICVVPTNTDPFKKALGMAALVFERLRHQRGQCLTGDRDFSATEPEARQKFAALPAWLRSKCAFGNDLLSDSEAALRILDAEWTVTAPKGNVVLFDSKGIHRGGMVLNKERIVLTCILG